MTTSRPSPREETEPPAPANKLKQASLRVIDAFLEFFQRQHNRLASSDERDDRHGRAQEQHEPEPAAVAARPSLLRRLLIGLLLLLAGLGVGGFLAYRTLSLKLKEHNSIVERMQEEVDAVRKEDARSQKLLDKFQRENAEYRHEAREAQREAEAANRRATELEAQIEETKLAEAKRLEDARRAEEAAQSARRNVEQAKQRSAKPVSVPQKTGNCAAGTAAEMAACIEKFNRQ
jgi:hypothetical protein